MHNRGCTAHSVVGSTITISAILCVSQWPALNPLLITVMMPAQAIFVGSRKRVSQWPALNPLLITVMMPAQACGGRSPAWQRAPGGSAVQPDWVTYSTVCVRPSSAPPPPSAAATPRPPRRRTPSPTSRQTPRWSSPTATSTHGYRQPITSHWSFRQE